MDDRFPPAATETLDGEWVGKFTENGEGCKLSLSGITATVRANMLTLRLLRGEHEATADIELNNGKFSAWNDLTMVANIVSDFGADVGDQRHRRPFQLSGKFDRKRMTGFLHSPTPHTGGKSQVTAYCAGTYTLARADSIEAEAILTGKPADLIEIERLLPPAPPVLSKTDTTGKQRTAVSLPGDETEKRLRQLKKWVEQGLIQPGEAAKKRAEILSKF